eukprot:TRINITY_DN104_c0_g1_i2.p1 TRINITY_DN104_c0_g1~~TRINITY_DN104_c0_g1_i2.p1  ORF type:complete len:463 (-),score=86.93 TRINITY_DN104_c0_g1_i2:196-1584(-)
MFSRLARLHSTSRSLTQQLPAFGFRVLNNSTRSFSWDGSAAVREATPYHCQPTLFTSPNDGRVVISKPKGFPTLNKKPAHQLLSETSILQKLRNDHNSLAAQEILQKYPIMSFTFALDSEGEVKRSVVKVLKYFFPHLLVEDASKLSIVQFKDGITNKLYKVEVPVPRTLWTPTEAKEGTNEESLTLLMRVYGKGTEILIDREAEVITMDCMNENGMAAPLYGRFQNGIIYGYTPGKPLTPDQMSERDKFPLIAKELARFHGIKVPTPRGRESKLLFQTIGGWLKEVPEHYSNPIMNDQFHRQFSMKWCRNELAMLEREILKHRPDIVFCHNDLLCGNIVYNERSDQKSIHFIDFEYGSYNYRLFDIGNHFCEMMGYDVNSAKYPTEEQQMKWLSVYKEAAGLYTLSLKQLYEIVNKFALAAHFYWGVWALVQARFSDINFDYLGYSNLRFSEYKRRKAQFL